MPGDLPQRTATGTEQAVQDPVDIGDEGEVDVEAGAVGRVGSTVKVTTAGRASPNWSR
ncbi:MAG: hypothetical protein M3Q72_11660 [Actinomycetota bacterium]|nr:hypothetical protein [Actinomycetota bacterium]